MKWLLDCCGFAEGAEVLAADQPPPYAVRMELVPTIQTSHGFTVQIVEAYATNFFFILIGFVAATCLETGKDVVFGRIHVVVIVGNGPDADMQTTAIGKKGREAGRSGGFKRQDLNGSSFMLG